VNSVEIATILITDLVGSTALGVRVGPDRAAALRREHFALLREGLSAGGGREVKNTGDGVMAVFPSASGAVRCAVALPQRLASRNRSAGEPLSIRIGLAAGRRRWRGRTSNGRMPMPRRWGRRR
jgi:class 3 adenylate cyclase